MKAAKEKGEVHKAEELENGDTLRQLLARSRYLLFKSPDKWTKSQKIRAELLFKQFEDIKAQSETLGDCVKILIFAS